MGTSGPSTSMRALSMPQPASAAKRCSTVPTRVPPRPSEVFMVVSTTNSESAGISTPSRTKTMPLSAEAGASVSRTFAPECNPMPSREARCLKVLWRKG